MASAKKIAELVRGFAVDQVVQGDGVLPTFTDQQVIDAINFAKADLFSKRPEAFSSSAIVITEPSDITEIADSALITGSTDFAKKQLNVFSSGAGQTASSYQHGKIQIEFKLNNIDNTRTHGNLFALGTDGGSSLPDEPIHFGQIENGHFAYRKNDTGDGTTTDLGIISTSKVDDGKKHFIEIDGTSQNTVTLSVDGTQEASVSHTDGIFDSNGFDDWIIGYAVSSGGDGVTPLPSEFQRFTYHSFNLYNLITFDNKAAANLVIETNYMTSSGFRGNSGEFTTTNSGYSAKTADTINMLNWAITPLSQKAASVLLSQQSKDVFYREASVALDKIYNGSI